MLYTAVVGADASIGPYKQVKNSRYLRGSLCKGAVSEADGGRDIFIKCRQVRSLPHPLRGSLLAERAFPQLQNFLNHLAKSFRVGYNRNIRKPIPCPNYGQHIIKV